MSEEVLVDVDGNGVMTVTLNRPHKKNALTNAVYGGIADAIERAETDNSVRVVVLQSEGDVFCAGNDIGDFAKANEGGAPRGPRNSSRMIQALARIEKPVLAAVQGAAVGIGTTMLMHVDLICMAEEGKLLTPFVNLALVPEASSSHLIPRRIGYSRAFAMFTLGEPIPARTCVEWGLAHVCVPRDKLRETVQGIARTLADKPLGSLCATKRLMREPEMVKAAGDRERGVFEERLLSKEAGEAFKAFAEKRKPNYRAVG
jgi:enoyl-CoA hydratase/carnithine racemase